MVTIRNTKETDNTSRKFVVSAHNRATGSSLYVFSDKLDAKELAKDFKTLKITQKEISEEIAMFKKYN